MVTMKPYLFSSFPNPQSSMYEYCKLVEFGHVSPDLTLNDMMDIIGC